MRAVIYKRVSSEEQKNNSSLDTQEEQCRAYAQNKHYTIVNVYADEGISGKSLKNRFALKQLLEDAKQKQFEVVIVWKTSRLARNTKDNLTILEKLLKNSVTIESVTEGYDVSNSAGKFMFTILSAQAEFDNAIKADNVRVAFHKKAQKEGISFRCILGYSYKDGKVEIIEQEAELVKTIFKTYLKTKSLNKTAIVLNKSGYRGKKGKLFKANSIKTILKNKAYISKNNLYSPIIDKNIYNIVNEIINKNEKSIY